MSSASAETVRPIAEKACRDVVGHLDGNLILAATQCILQNMTKDKAIRTLTPYLASATPDFVESLWRHVENRDFNQEPTKDTKSTDKPRKKRFRDFDDIIDETPVKQHAPENDDIIVNLKSGVNPAANTVMEEAKKQIENRKKFLKNLTAREISKVAEIQTLSREGMDRARRAAELQARIQNAMQRNNPTMPFRQNGPTPLLLNDSGTRVDAVTGDVKMFQKAVPSLLANQNVMQREEIKKQNFVVLKAKEETKKEWSKPEEIEEESQFKDNRIGSGVNVRKRRAFNFVTPGKYIKEANQQRLQDKMKKLQEKISEKTRETGIQQATALLAPRSRQEWELHVPEVEWWDSTITKDDYQFNSLIEHPEQTAPPAEAPAPDAVGLYLTKKERKKMRRLNRKEVQKEEQEKVRLGLLPPPEPKVKLANMMRVLDSAAVADPTKVEKHVREQMAKRQKKHEQDNLARKLTDDQKREKKIRKLQEDTSLGVKVSIYRIRSLKDAAKKFKIEMNSKQLYMTGAVILNKECSIVVAEGGPKSQRKFKRLLLNRIKWAEDTIEYDDGNSCDLVWEGETKEARFGNMLFKVCTTENLAREFFKDHKCEHYWDLAHSKATITKED